MLFIKQYSVFGKTWLLARAIRGRVSSFFSRRLFRVRCAEMFPGFVALDFYGENMEVRFLESNADYPAVLEVLLQLRTNYDAESLSAQIKKQESEGYQVVYVRSPDGILAVAGFVVGEKLAWGKHLYIDDLVTSADHRSSGVGEFLISWIKDYAREIGCEQIHLDSGVQRFPAHKFYLREGFSIASHHFSIVGVKND